MRIKTPSVWCEHYSGQHHLFCHRCEYRGQMHSLCSCLLHCWSFYLKQSPAVQTQKGWEYWLNVQLHNLSHLSSQIFTWRSIWKHVKWLTHMVLPFHVRNLTNPKSIKIKLSYLFSFRWAGRERCRRPLQTSDFQMKTGSEHKNPSR